MKDAPGGGLAVDTGALQATIGPEGRLVELSLPGKPNVLSRRGGWNPGFGFRVGPAGDDSAKATAFEEWQAKAGKPEVAREGDALVVRVEQRFEPWLKCTKSYRLVAGKATVRVRCEAELLQPARISRLGLTWVTSPDVDALAHPGAAGSSLLTGHTPGKYFRTPAAEREAGFADFRRERWLAALARPRGEGLGFLFPDLSTWADFKGQANLASFLKEGGYVLEFGNPAATGADQGSLGFRDYAAGARLVLDMAFVAFAGDAAPACRAALAEMGAPPAPADYPVRATPFPMQLTADFTGGVPTFHILPGSPLAPAFGFTGRRDEVKDLSLVLEVPAGVKVATAFFLHPSLNQPQALNAEEVRRGGQPYRRYRFAIPYRAIGKDAPPWATVFSPFLEAEAGFGEGDLYYHLESSAGAGPEERIHLKALPPLAKVALPKHFDLMPWYEMTLACKDTGVRQSLIETLERVGVRGKSYSSQDLALERALKARRWRLRLGMGWGSDGPYGFTIHNYGRIDWVKRGYPEDVWVLDNMGKRRPGTFCLSYVVGRGPLFLKEYQEYLESVLTPEAKELCWAISNDYEPSGSGVLDATRSCFCPRCLDQFAERSGLARAEVSAPEAILSRHRAEWTRFRMWQNAEIIHVHSELVRKLAPGLVNSICSHWVADPPGSEVFDGEAVDVRTFDAYADQHTPMMYHGGTRFFDNIQRTARFLKKPILCLTAAFYDAWSNESVVFSPEEVRQNLMAISAAGCVGAGFYASFDHFDGAYLHAIQAAMADIARLEPYLQGAVPSDGAASVEGLPREELVLQQDGKERVVRIPEWGGYLRSSVRRRGDQVLVAVFNYHRQEAATVRVKLPRAGKGGRTAMDPLSGACLTRGKERAWNTAQLAEGIPVRVPPLSFRTVLVRAVQAADVRLPAEDTAALLSAWQKGFRRRTERQDSLSGGGVGIEWVDAPGGQRIRVRSASQEVLIAPAQGGRILSWQAGGKTLAISSGAKGEGVGVDVLWAPEKARWCGDEEAAYEVKERAVREGAAVITLERVFAGSPLVAGLVLRKSYRIEGARPEIGITYALANRGGAAMEVALWAHHVFQPGLEAIRQAGQTPLYGAALLVPWVDGIREVRGADGDCVFTVSAGGDLPGGQVSGMRKHARESMVGDRIAVAGPDAAVVARFEKAKVSQVYSWRGEPPTHEWMYLPVKLAPGEAWQTAVTLLGMPGATKTSVAKELQE